MPEALHTAVTSYASRGADAFYLGQREIGTKLRDAEITRNHAGNRTTARRKIAGSKEYVWMIAIEDVLGEGWENVIRLRTPKDAENAETDPEVESDLAQKESSQPPPISEEDFDDILY